MGPTQRSSRSPSSTSWSRRVTWFVLLWALGVAAVSLAAFAIRMVLAPGG